MMRVVLAVLVMGGMLLGGADVDAKKKRHRDRDRGQTILVEDYTSAAWEGIVAETVDDFTAVLPEGVTMQYQRRDVMSCDSRKNRSQYRVAVCSVATIALPNGDTAAGTITGDIRDGSVAVAIILSDAETGTAWLDGFRGHLVCHEMMHVLTDIPDNYGAMPTESCVWGDLSDPGPFDVAYLAGVFGEHHRRGSARALRTRV